MVKVIFFLALLAPTQVGDPTVEIQKSLKRLEDKKNAKERLQAAFRLADLNANGQEVVTALGKATADADLKVRAAALTALRLLGPDAAAATPALVKALQAADPLVRELAAKALAAIGPRAKAAEAALTAAVQDRSSNVCRAAAQALAAIAATSDEAFQKLERALDDDDLSVRLAAARALTDLAPAQKSIVQKLALVALGPKTTKDPKAKKEITRDTAKEREDRVELRAQALRALAAMGPAADAAVPQLTALIEDKDADASLRRQAIRLLGSLGPAAQAAQPELQKLLAAKVATVRLEAALALVRIDPEGPQAAVALLGKVLSKPGPAERVHWLAELGKTMTEAKAPPDDLAKLFRELAVNDPEPAVRRVAVGVVGRLKEK